MLFFSVSCFNFDQLTIDLIHYQTIDEVFLIKVPDFLSLNILGVDMLCFFIVSNAVARLVHIQKGQVN